MSDRSEGQNISDSFNLTSDKSGGHNISDSFNLTSDRSGGHNISDSFNLTSDRSEGHNAGAPEHLDDISPLPEIRTVERKGISRHNSFLIKINYDEGKKL